MNTNQAVHPPDDVSALALARVALALGELAAALGIPPAREPASELGTRVGWGTEEPLLSAAMPVLADLVRITRPEEFGERLTPREHEVLELLVLGLTDREIAERLYISPYTAETHVKRVRAKFGGGPRAATVARALGGDASLPSRRRRGGRSPRLPAP